MAKHTTAMLVVDHHGFSLPMLVTKDQVPFRAIALMKSSDTDEEDARRLAACWNALDGVTTEELESGAFKEEIRLNLELRDELRAALQAMVDYGWQGCTDADKEWFRKNLPNDPITHADAVLAKVRP